MKRSLFILIGSLLVIVCFSSMLQTSDAINDEPSISKLVGFGTRDRIILLWEVDGESDRLTGFQIYRGIFPEDDSLMYNIEHNGNYSPIWTLKDPKTRIYEDYFGDRISSTTNTEYIYKVVPLIDNLKLKGQSTRTEMIFSPGDSDNDGIPDGFEFRFGLDYQNSSDAMEDPDHDHVTNLYEYYFGTNPWDRNSKPVDFESYMDTWEEDLDLDGMQNDWEILYGFNPMDSSDALLDMDEDGISNLEEYQNDTRPDIKDEVIISNGEDNGSENMWAFIILAPLLILITIIFIFNFIRKTKEPKEDIRKTSSKSFNRKRR